MAVRRRGGGLMKRQNRSFRSEWGFFLCSCMAVGTFILSCLALHDLQTAEGVGLYIAILLQRDDRFLFDLLVDISGAIALLLCTVIPCIGKSDAKRKFTFLMVAFVALMPTASPASLIHLFNNPENYRICSSVAELLESAEQLAPAAGFWVPVLCLLSAADRLYGTVQKPGRRQLIFLMIQPFLAAFVLLLPGFASHLSFVMQYLLLLSAFEVWESLHEKAEKFFLLEFFLFLGLWLRGGYVLLELMSRY